MALTRALALSAAIALAGCGGTDDPLPAGGADQGSGGAPGPAGSPAPATSPSPVRSPTPVGSPGPATSPSPAASPTPRPSPVPSPSPTFSPAPIGSPSFPRRSIVIVGAGNPPPEPPIDGDLEIEAIVRTDTPSQVDFYIDGRFVNSDRRWPYMLGGGVYDGRQLDDGRHVLDVVAHFPDGTDLAVSQPFWTDN